MKCVIRNFQLPPFANAIFTYSQTLPLENYTTNPLGLCNTKYSTYKSGPKEELKIWGASDNVMGIICPPNQGNLS